MKATRAFGRRLIAFLLLLFSDISGMILAAEPSCGTPPSLKTIEKLAKAEGLEMPDASLVEAEAIPAEHTGLCAVRVRVLMRVPALEIVYLKARNSWHPILVNKDVAPGWEKHLEYALEEAGPVLSGGPLGLAEELTRILVDSNTRYGVLLLNRSSIPVDYESSDRLRDLRRQGLPSAEIEARLLATLSRPITPPVFEVKNGKSTLVFTTWHYFGGEVSHWTIDFAAKPSVKKRVVATQVGSFDYYY